MAGSEEKKKQKKRRGGGAAAKGGGEAPAEMISDDRFASAQSDPRFMEAPKKRSKIAIDSRFQRLFTDTAFSNSNAPIDKRGKPTATANNGKASLKHYYRQQEEEDEEVEDDSKMLPIEEDEDEEINSDDSSESENDDEDESSSTTDSDDQSVDDDDEEDTFVLEDNVPETDTETRRLAIVNLDWSQVRAADLYVLLSSFLPKGGQITSVTVYPSEFGIKRMEEEAVHGPVGLFDDEEKELDDDDDDDDDEIDNKKLRAYELSRLRYYYAVVECDSSATADYLYKTCDGVEFERSANKLDLRFIPDSMEFKHQPRDVATEAPTDYEGLDFQTRALQHSNINLTWDEDEPQRVKTLKRKLNDEQLAELELKEFLASDGSETEDDDNNIDGMEENKSMKKRKKQDLYRALIQSGDGGSDEDDEEDNDQDMEVTFNSGLEDISKRILEKKDKQSETVWEAHLRKKREKKKASKSGSKKYDSSDDESSDGDQDNLPEQPDDFFVDEPDTTSPVKSTKNRNSGQDKTNEEEASRAELELILADDKGANTNLKGYNLKPKKIKGKKGKAIPDEGKIPTVEYDDSRFSALFTSPLYALDPTDPQFKRSAVYARQITQKQKLDGHENVGEMDGSEIPGKASMHKGEHVKSDGLPQNKEKNELSSLVRSIKMKSKQVPLPRQGKEQRKYKDLQHKTKVQQK